MTVQQIVPVLDLNWVDGVLLTALLLSILIGLWRGLVYEVLSLAGWVAAFVVAQAYASVLAQWLPLHGWVPAWRMALAFVLLFVGTAFAAGLVAWLIKRMVASVGLRPIDRVLGGAFGLARGLLILLGAALVVNMTSWRSEAAWQTARVATFLGESVHTLRPLLPNSLARHLP